MRKAVGYVLFGANIPPKCEYCGNGRKSQDGFCILCCHKGVLEPEDHCGRFLYDPFLRIPRREPVLPHFDPEEFRL